MRDLQKKKLNILAHIAQIDGKIDTAEAELLKQLARDYNVSDLDYNVSTPEIPSISKSSIKVELLYLAIHMAKIDGDFHSDEQAYIKSLALKLNFKHELVDQFITQPLLSLEEFRLKAQLFALHSS